VEDVLGHGEVDLALGVEREEQQPARREAGEAQVAEAERQGAGVAVAMDLDHPSSRRVSAAARTVRSMSSSECASDTNAASNWLGARYTPRASRPRKNRPKRAVSERLAGG